MERLIYTNIGLRTVSGADAEFIEKVYFSTRNEEFAMLGWSPEQLEMFLKMQLNFQQQSYRMQFPGAEHFVISFESQPVGRLIVFHSQNELRLVDIAVLPEFRNQGIGALIIGELLKDAEKDRKKLALQVLKTNPKAFNLYKRLGFAVNGEDEMYYSMEQ